MSQHPADNRIVSFPNEMISCQEIASFYELSNIKVGEEKPYAWSMSVTTVDGFLSFKEDGCSTAKEVAMSHVPGSGSLSDWRFLNGGWMIADAVLSSGANIRSEPHMKYIPHFEDMIDYRVNILKKPKYPTTVILSGSGKMDLTAQAFHVPECPVIIITSEIGVQEIEKNRSLLKDSPLVKVEVVGKNAEYDASDFKEILKILRQKYEIKYLDVTAGGVVIGALLWHKYIDEVRVTISGQIAGEQSKSGEKRPKIVSMTKDRVFTPDMNPHLKYTKIGLFGNHHLFVRSEVEYRH
eukprot:TRINITY_DN1998_c0_g1_i2.p1 TRINITY_DN1998_c0_g1~~TRINITY_DN1998_c0_g1_i2.p1  ORF type:complete len:295 (-),score=62.88 TRINITY_DN1998_c0_g1_i2:612-1496(-)